MIVLKKFLSLLLLSAAVLQAQSGTIDLRSHGSLEIYLEDNWKMNTSEFGDRVIVNIEPKDEAINANAALTITFPEQDRYSTKPKLKTQVEVIGRVYEEGSVERKSVSRELNTRAGYGFYCSYTDPELVGKPPQKGNFKGISVGLIRVAPDVLIELAISADDFRGKPYQELLGAIEGMEYKPRRLARR
ncbi:MAG: hypothetical protein ABIZ81_01560 [Opitutaceae bacterium]